MIMVTESAKEALKKALSASTEDSEVVLRLTPAEVGRYDLVLDHEREGDQVVEHLGAKVLLIEQQVSEALDKLTLDYRQAGATMCLVICDA
jgi:Fe-S cluster assembly iron-binding protein IscA